MVCLMDIQQRYLLLKGFKISSFLKGTIFHTEPKLLVCFLVFVLIHCGHLGAIGLAVHTFRNAFFVQFLRLPQDGHHGVVGVDVRVILPVLPKHVVVVPLHPGEGTHVHVEHKVPQHLQPRRVVRKVVVELCRYALHLG